MFTFFTYSKDIVLLRYTEKIQEVYKCQPAMIWNLKNPYFPLKGCAMKNVITNEAKVMMDFRSEPLSWTINNSYRLFSVIKRSQVKPQKNQSHRSYTKSSEDKIITLKKLAIIFFFQIEHVLSVVINNRLGLRTSYTASWMNLTSDLSELLVFSSGKWG